ncbi:MAG TPA: hypothetical protein DD723_05175 [Candidatus Omnitrophica bacterium]|nr:MAG: hypothetical protein A2Z81_04715 [Omnitrophica WOR_2 bacterium GWA2_45_18]HBR14922.1 hypothetical protein [Candidatus Omnitrophota bacterium]
MKDRDLTMTKRCFDVVGPFAVICILAVGLYFKTLQYGFHFDDFPFIVQNPAITHLQDIREIWNSKGASTRFVGWASFALNYHFHKLNPAGYHLTNMVIHAINGILVYWLMTLLVTLPRFQQERISRDKKWIALAVALLFVAHPVQTQAVTYITQRFASLAAAFFLCSVCCYVKGRRIMGSILIKGIFFFLSGAAAVLGALTKEIVITLPFIIILMERMLSPLGHPAGAVTGAVSRARGKTWKGVYFLLALVFFLMIPFIYSRGRPETARALLSSKIFESQISESHDGDRITPGTYLLTQARVFMTLLRLLVIPLGQNLDYDFPVSRHIFEPGTFICIVGIGLFVLTALRVRRERPLVAFGLGWIFMTFSVELIPRPNVIWEHKAYLLSVGFILGLVVWLYESLKDSRKFAGVVLVLVVLLSFLTIQRNKIWENEVVLWNDVVKKSPRKIRPYLNLARAVEKYGRYDLALDCYDQVIAMKPDNAVWYNNRGVIQVKLKQPQRALADYNQSLRLDPKYVAAYINRANLYADGKAYDLALADFETALRYKDDFHITFLNRGTVHARMGNYDLAIADYTRAVANYDVVWKTHDGFWEAFRNRGDAYKMKGDYERALADYNRVIELQPQSAVSYYHRSLAYQAKGDYPKALKDVLNAQRLGYAVDPQYIYWLKESLRNSPSSAKP